MIKQLDAQTARVTNKSENYKLWHFLKLKINLFISNILYIS